MTDWQPIATAPRDGTWILILCPESIQDSEMPKPCVFTTRWVPSFQERWDVVDENTKKRVLTDWSHWCCYEEPTHWCPLPSAQQDHPI